MEREKRNNVSREDFADDVRNAVEVMNRGGIILYPTDTIWGIGCDATNEEAVQKIFDIKHRPENKTMLVLLDAPGKLQGYVDVPDMVWDFMELATRPTTIIYPNARNLAPSLIAEDKTVGIRVTSDPFCVRLCQALHRPVVSTSANISGQPSAAFFNEISQEIIDNVDYVVKYRQKDMTKASPSVIIKLGMNNEFKIIRK